MNLNGYQTIADIILKAEGLYLSIFDIKSEFDARNVGATTLALAKEKAGHNTGMTILYFNELIGEYADARMFQCWTLTFDGVYRIHVKSRRPKRTKRSSDEEIDRFIIPASHSPLIKCPSGMVVVDNLFKSNANEHNIFEVDSGVYLLQLSVDWKQVDKHQFLEDPAEYPPADGPEWTIYMQLLS